MFNPTFWAVTQPLGLNNPIAGFIHILHSIFLECMYVIIYYLIKKIIYFVFI